MSGIGSSMGDELMLVAKDVFWRTSSALATRVVIGLVPETEK